MKRKILGSLLVIAAVVSLVGAVTWANFNDIEKSSGNTFVAPTLDLEWDINGGDWINGQDVAVFFVPSVLPGQGDEATLSFHNNSPDLTGDLFVTLDNIDDDDNGCVEPEWGSGDRSCGPDGGGELSSQLHFQIWIDDGDNIFEPEERDVEKYNGKLGDIKEVGELVVEMGPCPPSCETFLAIAWEFQDRPDNDLAQTDSASFDLTFALVQQTP